MHFRYGVVNQKVSYLPQSTLHSENYYLRQPQKKTDYKVFHKIPASSLLLTSYDPFYSPLLSRLDAVFQQLGLGATKSAATEKCRERLVCMMYANPAKYAPYSNLVSAQLSRLVLCRSSPLLYLVKFRILFKNYVNQNLTTKFFIYVEQIRVYKIYIFFQRTKWVEKTIFG